MTRRPAEHGPTVLQLRSEFRDNGPGTQALTLGKELRQRGYRVVYAASGGVLVPDILDAGFAFHRIESLAVDRRGIVDVARSILALRRLVRSERPDVIHAHNAASIMMAAIGARLAFSRPRLVQSVRGLELRPGYGWRNRIYTINPAQLLAVSEFTKRELVSAGAHANRITVTFNGADLDRFDPDTVDGDRIRAEFGLDGRRLVGHVGNFSGWKGQDVLVRALAMLGASHPDVHLVLVGDGPERANVQQLAGSLGLESRVTFPGLRRDIPEFQAAFDLYCQPSTQGEMFPNAIVEAMAMANPWVGSDLSGLSELTVDGQAGDVVQPGNVEALAAKIGERLVDADDLVRRGAIARRFVEENLTVARVTDRVERAYGLAARPVVASSDRGDVRNR